jgi:SHS family lactate transporter-like MFS transporter
VLYVRRHVKEPEVWVANRDKQREQNKEFRAPLFDIFRRRVLGNTITACLWMASSFVVYYSVYGLIATHLQKDLSFSPGMVALPVALANLTGFLASGFWGWVADRYGRRWSMIIPAVIGIFVTPLYLFTADYAVIAVAFSVQGVFLGAIYGRNPSYLAERFPTEVRATQRLLLPSGRRLGRPCCSRAGRVRRWAVIRLRHSHAGWHGGWRAGLHRCVAARA